MRILKVLLLLQTNWSVFYMNTKEKILQTALLSFLDNGYKGTTYQDLIHATKLSKGSFYHYYQNKNELFKAVISKYFLSYFDSIDWEKLKKLDYPMIEKSMENYYHNFITEINDLTKKGLSRYIILFFEALEIYPEFKESVQKFYTQLKETLESKNPDKSQDAVEIIAKYEGLIFWKAVFSDEQLNNLKK